MPDEPTRARGSLRGNGEETREIDNPLTKQKEVVHTYGWYLRKFMADAKEKGAEMSIVCSPVPRNRWTGDKTNRDTTFSVWGQEAAKQSGMPFVNLNEIIAKRYDALGKQKVTDDLFPANETVHTDWAGAVLNAECVVEGLKSLDKCDLKKYLLAEPPKDLKNPGGKRDELRVDSKATFVRTIAQLPIDLGGPSIFGGRRRKWSR